MLTISFLHRVGASAMLAQQDLHHAMRNQLMQGKQLAIGGGDGIHIQRVCRPST